MRKTEFAKYVYIGIVTIIYAICLYMLGRNLTFETLTYDEAGQFFISKGLNHYSEPYAPEGSITDVIEQNSLYNQDPGGFSIILHYWSKISNNIVYLRLLPLLFFIGAIIFTCLAVYEITRKKLTAYASGLLLFALWGGPLPYELRPYSMELCGMAYGIWLIFHIIRYRANITGAKLLSYSIIFSLFLTARYTIIMFGFIYTLFIIHSLWYAHTGNAQENTSQKLKQIIIFVTPVICAVAYSYIFAARIQNSSLHSWGYIVYLYTSHWPFKLYALGLLFSILTLKWQHSRTRLLTYICICINILFIILGYLKLLPWTFIGHKGAAFVWLWYITLFCISSDLLKASIKRHLWVNYIYVCIICLLIYLSHLQFNTLGLIQMKPLNIERTLKDLPANITYPILVCETLNPTLRYYYEHTENPVAAILYPESFILFTGQAHADSVSNPEHYDPNQKEAEKQNAPSGTIFLNVYSYTGEEYTPQIFIKSASNEFNLMKSYY